MGYRYVRLLLSTGISTWQVLNFSSCGAQSPGESMSPLSGQTPIHSKNTRNPRHTFWPFPTCRKFQKESLRELPVILRVLCKLVFIPCLTIFSFLDFSFVIVFLSPHQPLFSTFPLEFPLLLMKGKCIAHKPFLSVSHFQSLIISVCGFKVQENFS